MDPFFKWVGGKKRMIKKYNELNLLPKAPNTVIEPFCGGAAMSLHLMPQRVLLNDTAIPVWKFWECIKNDPQSLITHCKKLQFDIGKLPVDYAYDIIKKSINTRLYLHRLGKERYDPDPKFVSEFLFLNKHGFNGLWRVNKQGLYNVPYGKYRSYKNWIPKLSDLEQVQDKLEDIEFRSYENHLFKFIDDFNTPDSFIYLDPPYYGTFSGYTKKTFGKPDHLAMKKSVAQYSQAKIALSSIDVPEIRELWSDWNIHTIPSKTTIQGEGSKVQNELLITNY